MSTAGFVLHKECVIKRPLDVVRAHYLDFAHHIAHGVHRGVEYTVLDRHDGGAKQRVVSRFRVMGMLKTDEVTAFVTPAGEIVQRFEKGDFAGGSIRIRFEREAPGVTHLYATFDAPLRGVNRLLAGIVKRTVDKLTEQAIEEDRLDLEGDYAADPELLAAIARIMAPPEADARAASLLLRFRPPCASLCRSSRRSPSSPPSPARPATTVPDPRRPPAPAARRRRARAELRRARAAGPRAAT